MSLFCNQFGVIADRYKLKIYWLDDRVIVKRKSTKEKEEKESGKKGRKSGKGEARKRKKKTLISGFVGSVISILDGLLLLNGFFFGLDGLFLLSLGLLFIF